MAADWSQLPFELLRLISEKLNNSEFYLLRFRSVCSTWRSSSIPLNNHQNPKPLKLPHLVPKKTITNVGSVNSHLIKHNILIIKPPLCHQTLHHRPWLIRIGPDSNGKIQLWHPFSFNQLLPSTFSSVIDFNKLSILDFGHVSYIHQTVLRRNTCSFFVATYQGEEPQVIVTVDFLGEPIIYRCGDHRWTKVPNMSTSQRGNYLCVFKGRPCVVDKTGQTVMIGPDLSVDLMAKPVFGGKSKVLVESSEFELLLVDIYRNCYREIVWIDVFSLDEKEKRWVKLTNLGDTVLFLACQGSFSFSASVSDLGFANGNCVIFGTSRDFYGLNAKDCGMSVFHLDQGRVSPLSDYPEYFKLLWPPPEWITELH